MADRLQISPATLRRLERGDPSLSIGTVAKALLVLNALDRFSQLLERRTGHSPAEIKTRAAELRISLKAPPNSPRGRRNESKESAPGWPQVDSYKELPYSKEYPYRGGYDNE